MYFHFCHFVIACNGNSIHVKVYAYLNGHPVYTYGGNEFFHGNLVGYGTQYISLPSSYNGKSFNKKEMKEKQPELFRR